jgi:hypothetical protein
MAASAVISGILSVGVQTNMRLGDTVYGSYQHRLRLG